MWKRALSMLLTAALVPLGVTPIHAQSCGTCKPPRLNIATQVQSIDLCFDSDDFRRKTSVGWRTGSESLGKTLWLLAVSQSHLVIQSRRSAT